MGQTPQGFGGRPMGKTAPFFEHRPKGAESGIGVAVSAVNHNRSQKTGGLPEKKKALAPVGEGTFDQQLPDGGDGGLFDSAAGGFGVPLESEQIKQGGRDRFRPVSDPDR
jgi:hypothetical protein